MLNGYLKSEPLWRELPLYLKRRELTAPRTSCDCGCGFGFMEGPLGRCTVLSAGNAAGCTRG